MRGVRGVSGFVATSEGTRPRPARLLFRLDFIWAETLSGRTGVPAQQRGGKEACGQQAAHCSSLPRPGPAR